MIENILVYILGEHLVNCLVVVGIIWLVGKVISWTIKQGKSL